MIITDEKNKKVVQSHDFASEDCRHKHIMVLWSTFYQLWPTNKKPPGAEDQKWVVEDDGNPKGKPKAAAAKKVAAKDKGNAGPTVLGVTVGGEGDCESGTNASATAWAPSNAFAEEVLDEE